MNEVTSVFTRRANRRKFLRNGMFAAGAAGVGMLTDGLFTFGDNRDDNHDRVPITKGDIAILRFLSALEEVEEDLWTQYSELGGVQDNEVSGVNGGIHFTRPPYRFLMATCLNTSTTTPMTRSVITASSTLS